MSRGLKMSLIACSCMSFGEEAEENIKCVWVCGYKGYTKHAVGSEYIEQFKRSTTSLEFTADYIYFSFIYFI